MDFAIQYYKNVIFPDVDKAPGTKKNYKKSITHLCRFLKYNKLENLKVTQFKYIHAVNFVDYLKAPIEEFDKQALNGQTANSVVRNIKPIFKRLVFEEQITRNPFDEVKVPFTRAVKPRLTNSDFRAIALLDLTERPNLEVYRDIFLFLCYTGLSFCDAIDLKKHQIRQGRMDIPRKKSKVLTSQFLIGQAVEIIEKYDIPEQRCLPKRSLDKQNLNLKLIALMAGLEIPLSTYTARRFFRQSISASGIRENMVIKSLMGHTCRNDMDSHYFYVSDEILSNAKVQLENYFEKILL